MKLIKATTGRSSPAAGAREGTDGASPRRAAGGRAPLEPRGGNAPPDVPVTDGRERALGPNSGGTADGIRSPWSHGGFGAIFFFSHRNRPILIIRSDQYEEHRKDHGEDRGPVQGPGLHLRRQRDLRRPCQHLGLRPPGRGAEEQREARLVEEVRPGEPLQRGAGRRHSDEPPGVGGLRPRGRLLRPPDGLQGVQGALPGGQGHRGLVPGERLRPGQARGRHEPGAR